MWQRLRPDASAVLDEERVRASLTRYFAVMQDEKPAKFQISKRIAAEFDDEDSTELLWRQHAELIGEHEKLEEKIDLGRQSLRETPLPKQSLLDLKVEIAGRILRRCHFCTRRCGVDRTIGEFGYCKCGSKIVVSSIFAHMGEEPELVPSGTIFTMGCTMRCKHCQNWTISQWLENGEVYDPECLAKEIETLRVNGCRNVNLVGGEPTPWLEQWLETFKHVNVNTPIVWNSNSYYSPEAAQLLVGFADIYLLDFKYGPERCAARVSDAPDYWEVCTRNHQEAKKHGEMIVRILVLPNHLDCCTKPIINWIAENLGVRTRVNVMFQYRPEWRACEMPELQRRLSRDEMETATRIAKEAKLANFIT
ncbi:MAG: radical SAM protein [Candidatus Bathyarchaeia archaeon]|jgi:putative pyruvate formate lyase activating enzyme